MGYVVCEPLVLLRTFFYTSMGENVQLSQISEIEILMDLHVLRFSESKNHIPSGWSICLRL